MTSYTPVERQAVVSLSGIFSLRMIGLFMILPVFAVYGTALEGATPLLIGLAVGAYGLAQLLLQIPFGLMADRHDRHRLIIIGLLLFIVGGLVAAASDSIWGVIIGRFLQGAGAISAVVMALLSDLVRDENRTKAMATVGMSIGLSFALAFVIGPLLADAVGLSGLFLATAVMGAFALLVCLHYVPRAGRAERQLPTHYLPHLLTMLRHPELMRLNIGIFCLHLVMTACFVVLPPLLVSAGLPASRHGWLYLPVMALALVALVPAVIIAEKRRRMREIYLLAVMLLGLSMLLLALGHAGLTGLVLAVALFFFAFNLLEALLPSLVSKLSPAGGKGTAMGVYSTCQFLGAFLGGALGGALQGWYGVGVLFICLAVMVLLWLVGAFAMRQPAYLHSLTLRPAEGGVSNDLLERLRAAPGVAELVLLPDDGDIHLKIDRLHWRAEVLEGLPVSVVG